MYRSIRRSFGSQSSLFSDVDCSIRLGRLQGVLPHTKHLQLIISSSSVKLMSTNSSSNNEQPFFNPKRALVLAKFSRYDFEKHRNPNLTEQQLIESLERRGSDYQSLLFHHKIHIANRDHIVQCLRAKNIDAKVVNRFSYTEELIDWADMIFTSGGDGTYLMAASKVRDNRKPLIGVNSDPSRSVGYLCLPKCYSNHFDLALDKILSQQFTWNFRQRIRITLESENADDEPVELHNQQLLHPEYRFLELDRTTFANSARPNASNIRKRLLPFRALNEVFVGESLSSRVSYFELAFNGDNYSKIKSSGLTICTGTGSTSWSFNINKLTPQCVHNLFHLINEECFPAKPAIAEDDQNLIHRITTRFNNSLIYSPSELVMAYTIRDPVVFGTTFNNKPRDFAKKVTVKSRMTDASIVIDGGLSYRFNDGAKATFETLEEDALRTIKLIE